MKLAKSVLPPGSLNRPLITLLFAIMVFSQACSGSSPDEEANSRDGGGVNFRKDVPLKIVATTTIIGDVISNIGGDKINLTVLIEAGQDPHSFEPTPSSLAAIEAAHIVFVNGFDLEESLLEVVEKATYASVVEVSEGIEQLEADLGDEHHTHGGIDPHVWFDPTNIVVWVDNIEMNLIELDPSNKDEYTLKADAYRVKLAALDLYIRGQVATLPDDARKLVTGHRMFEYFADEYGFEIVGTILPGPSTFADASARSIADLVELINNEGVFTLFVGSTAGMGLGKLANTVASELGKNVRIVETLTGSLSIQGGPGDSYLKYMKYNIARIMDGLRS
jgi:ABC-type Zn uptake system ZnuABC Zn-binding protein ZnuA